MKEFGLGAFALELATIEVRTRKHLESGLERVAQRVEKTAKAELGTYQPEVGPFQDWAELAESTKADRVRKGFTEDDPGLRSGEMQNSVEHQVHGLEAEIGSNDQNLVYFEFGTAKQPPRPVLGPAVIHNEKAIRKILGQAVVTGLIGGELIHQSLEYDREVS